MPDGDLTVVDLITRVTERHPAEAAIVLDDGALTFSDLYERAAGAAAWLERAGARVGQVVVIALRDSPESRIAEWAVLGFGLVRAAVSVRLHPAEIAAVAIAARAALVLTERELAAPVRSALEDRASSIPVVDSIGHLDPVRVPPAPSAEADALAILTSGTTGTPRAHIVSQSMWVAQTRRALAALPPIGPRDTVLAAGQLPSLGGSLALNVATAGARSVFLPRFDPAIVADVVEAHGVTILPLAASMLDSLVTYLSASRRRLPTLRAVPYGGSAIGATRLARAVALLPDVLVQFYGLAQALAPLSVLSPADHRQGGRLLSSAGRWLDGVENRVIDGELQVRGEVVVVPGWLGTGDRAEFHDGFLYLSGRTDDAITTGGYTVHPAEIESVLMSIPGVEDVVVVGTPHSRWGEGITAVAVLRAPLALLDDGTVLGEFQRTCRGRLAGFKKPVALSRVRSIPLTASGKPDRRAARSLAMASLYPEEGT